MTRLSPSPRPLVPPARLARRGGLAPVLATAFVLAGCAGTDPADDDAVFPDGGGVTPTDSADASSPGAGAPDLDTAPTDPVPGPGTEPALDREVTSFFFSYDEAGSTASRDLSLFAIAEGRRPDPALGRPFEFLNAERFDDFGAETAGPLRVSMGLLAGRGDIPLEGEIGGEVYALGVNVAGPSLSRDERPNVVLTVLLDTSGSMDDTYAAETRRDVRSLLDVAKTGLRAMQGSLKAGDVVNLVTFSTNARIVFEGAEGGSGDFTDTIDAIRTEGSTNLDAGVALAYEVANRTFDPEKANRVVLVTDAFLNTGRTNVELIARNVTRNGLEGIYLAGIGVGGGFNDRALNELTDVGRGEYSAMITPTDAERLFTSGFTRFIEPAARDVRFRLTFPQALDQLQSSSEEISESADEVRPTNFAYGSEQFFLELFTGPEALDGDERITLDVTYTDEAGEPRDASVSRSVDELLGADADAIRAAALVSALARLIAGELSCPTVQDSPLYLNRVANDVYTRYRQAIGDFCGAAPR